MAFAKENILNLTKTPLFVTADYQPLTLKLAALTCFHDGPPSAVCGLVIRSQLCWLILYQLPETFVSKLAYHAFSNRIPCPLTVTIKRGFLGMGSMALRKRQILVSIKPSYVFRDTQLSSLWDNGSFSRPR